jgi:hypothetical protein
VVYDVGYWEILIRGLDEVGFWGKLERDFFDQMRRFGRYGNEIDLLFS